MLAFSLVFSGLAAAQPNPSARPVSAKSTAAGLAITVTTPSHAYLGSPVTLTLKVTNAAGEPPADGAIDRWVIDFGDSAKRKAVGGSTRALDHSFLKAGTAIQPKLIAVIGDTEHPVNVPPIDITLHPQAPTQVTAERGEDSSMMIGWVDNCPVELTNQVEFSTDGLTFEGQLPMLQDATYDMFAEVPEAPQLYARVRANTLTGPRFSEAIIITTPRLPPRTPLNFQAFPMKDGSIEFVWTDWGNPIAFHRIEASEDGVNWRILAEVPFDGRGEYAWKPKAGDPAAPTPKTRFRITAVGPGPFPEEKEKP
jgi:hypothetical protein